MSSQLHDAMVAPAEAAGRWETEAWRIGVDVAGPAADDVDREARFPHEAVSALRASGFMAALLPAEVGGADATITELVGAVRAIAAHCASSALVLAMHSIEAVNLRRHGTTPALRGLMGEVATTQLVIANANSEVGLGGDVGRSSCALEGTGTTRTLDKQALAVSYGEYADVVVATARRDPDASATDQAFCVLRRADYTLEPTSTWDTLGLRGTCSRGFRVRADVDMASVFPVPFATVATDGGGQARQLLLSAVWVGLAEAAASRAHDFVRAASKKSIGTVLFSANRLAEIAVELHQARGLLAASSLQFDELDATGDLDSPGYIMALRTLKVATSSLAVQTATAALGICGIAGYRRDTPYSLDRIIRDAHGGLIMVSNDRLVQDNAQMLIALKQL